MRFFIGDPMIDIHTHLLYGVDDGPDDFKESVAMLEEAARQGITHIILTPHYRRRMFSYPKDRIKDHMEKLMPEADRCGIRIYPGCEYHVNSSIVSNFDEGRCSTLADSPYVLAEYEWQTEASYIRNTVGQLLSAGYQPIIAHVERYECMLKDKDLAADMQDMGALIQVNADAVLGKEGWRLRRYTKYLIRNGFADIVASDSHGISHRSCHMKASYEHVAKKFGNDTADSMFIRVPEKILKTSTYNRSNKRDG